MRRERLLKSQRLLRKGALAEETYELFRGWHDDSSFDENFRRVFAGHFGSEAWKEEVRKTLALRFSDPALAMPLIVLARGGFPMHDWKHCLLLTIASSERDYWEFAENWLFPEYVAGRYRIRTEDVAGFVRAWWAASRNGSLPLTEYGTIRTARDLIRMARDLGVLRGDGPEKEFARMSLGDTVFLFACHFIAEFEGGTARIPDSPLWKAFLVDPRAVEEALLRLHQFRLLEYQVAGSLVAISLPCAGAREFARSMVAERMAA